ncbi:MAG: hypothetical protein CM15mP127_13570 [Gammaproteobacteria bacterium]|nr:MAG: hypothetical protein CM15mP127_13570 [Gammaproteobacteria bacterium]
MDFDALELLIQASLPVQLILLFLNCLDHFMGFNI